MKKYNPKAKPNVQAKHILRPIPQSQIDGVVVGPEVSAEPRILTAQGHGVASGRSGIVCRPPA